MGCDITKVDEEYTVATMCKKKHDEIVALEVLRMKPGDPEFKRKINQLWLKWHPNFLRRWLFRLFRI